MVLPRYTLAKIEHPKKNEQDAKCWDGTNTQTPKFKKTFDFYHLLPSCQCGMAGFTCFTAPKYRPTKASLAPCLQESLCQVFHQTTSGCGLKGGWLKDLPKMKKERVQGITFSWLVVLTILKNIKQPDILSPQHHSENPSLLTPPIRGSQPRKGPTRRRACHRTVPKDRPAVSEGRSE